MHEKRRIPRRLEHLARDEAGDRNIEIDERRQLDEGATYRRRTSHGMGRTAFHSTVYLSPCALDRELIQHLCHTICRRVVDAFDDVPRKIGAREIPHTRARVSERFDQFLDRLMRRKPSEVGGAVDRIDRATEAPDPSRLDVLGAKAPGTLFENRQYVVLGHAQAPQPEQTDDPARIACGTAIRIPKYGPTTLENRFRKAYIEFGRSLGDPTRHGYHVGTRLARTAVQRPCGREKPDDCRKNRHMAASDTSSIPPSTVTPKKRGGRLKRWLLTLLVVVVAILALGYFLAPVVVRSNWIRGKIVTNAEDNLDAKVTIDSIDFSWGDGIVLTGLSVANPTGFPDGPALRVGRIDAGLSWKSLLTGRIAIQAAVQKPEVFVHVLENGRINLVEMQKNKAAGDDGGSSKKPEKKSDERDFDYRVRFEVDGGLVEVHDASRGIEERIQNIRLALANSDFGSPVGMSFDAELAGKDGKAKGTLTARAQADPRNAQPLDFFSFETSGFELGDYAALVAAFVEGDEFESLRGHVRGKLAAKPVEQNGARQAEFAITGDLVVSDLDVRGGPFGEGRGIVSKAWTIRPNLRFDPEKKTGSFDGTDVDLGFATMRALPATEANSVLGEGAKPSGAVGLVIDVDLAKLGEQPLLPKGTYAGNLRLKISGVPPSGEDATTLPFGLVVDASNIRVRGDFLKEPLAIADPVQLESRGKLVFGDGMPATDATFGVRGAGLDGGGSFGMTQDGAYSAKAGIDVISGPLVALLGGFFPTGLGLEGKGRIDANVKGRLPRDDRSGGLLAEDLPEVDAKLMVPTVTWFGSRLAGLTNELRLTDGKLDVTTPSGAMLNAGPLSIALHAKDLMGDASTLAFDVSWNGGRANGGMVPALQYAVPLLAGLPTNDLNAIAGIAFDATTALKISGNGPLPKSADAVMSALEKWSASGNVELSDGSFTPSPLLTDVFRFFGDQNKIAFSNISSKIRVKDGKVWTDGFELGGKDGIVRLSGSTTLSGQLDVKLDLTDVLSKHKDGQKILSVLGGKLSTDLAGTLWTPKLDLGATIDNALKSALKNTVEDATKGAIDDLLKGKKPDLGDLFKKLGGKK